MNDTTTAPCMRCGGDAEWSVGHVFDTDLYNDVHIYHAFVCDGCGTTVKQSVWPTYQRFAKRKLTEHKSEGTTE